MRILIVGFGSIARRHLQQLKAIDPAGEVAVLRRETSSPDLGEFKPLVARVFLKEAEALAWRPEAVLIANPAPLHVPTALRFAGMGCHLFIEKPLADNEQGLDALAALTEEKGLVVQVGYVLRFLKPLEAMKNFIGADRLGRIFSLRAAVGQNLRTWRAGQDYRQGVTASAGLGGGVVLELSHELDYAVWLLGPVARVQAMTATAGDLGVTVEDVAEILVQFRSGAIGNIHLDMLDHASHRQCRIIGEKGTLEWSKEKAHQVSFYDAAAGQWSQVWGGVIDYNDMYRSQLEYFLECIRSRRTSRVSLAQGRQALELALAVKQSSLTGREVVL